MAISLSPSPSPSPTYHAPSLAEYNLEIENGVLSLLIQFGPEVWGDFYLINESDFSKALRPLWQVIAQQLSQTPPASVSPMVLAERLKGYSVMLDGAFEVYPYLEGLRLRFVQKGDAAGLARELKRVSVRRELIKKVEETKRELVTRPNATFEEMTGIVERGLSSVSTDYYKPDVHEVMSEAIIRTVEDRADHPIDPSEMLYQGPLQSMNKTVGPLIFPGSFTTVIARTATGKSSFGFFYCISVAERYQLPLLWLDAAEMTVEQLQMRAVCCFSEGRIPLWAVRSGEWRNNPAWSKIIRNEVWPRVRKLSMTYKNVGGMSPIEKINFIRRFYYNKVGRGRFLIIGDDYLKGVESLSKNTAEYQALGFYVGDVKTLVTDEINAGYWTSLQGNRSGIVTGKRLSEIQDSGEASAGISDRVVQQSTNAFLMRFKVTEELAKENNLFGNMVLKKAKIREGYGKDYETIMRPVKLPSGGFIDNYWHLQTTNFFYLDKGLHSDAMQVLGHGRVAMGGVYVSAAPL